MWVISFIITSVLLGVGLAMDAFSVTVANTMQKPGIKKSDITQMAALFAFFQFAMPMIGWVLVHTIISVFTALEMFIPWIALGLLSFIGIKMIIGEDEAEGEGSENVGKNLLIQAIATSIDALSVGFTIANYGLLKAFVASLIIAVVTFGICIFGGFVGKKLGSKFTKHANHVGGVILIAIGLEILLTNLLG